MRGPSWPQSGGKPGFPGALTVGPETTCMGHSREDPETQVWLLYGGAGPLLHRAVPAWPSWKVSLQCRGTDRLSWRRDPGTRASLAAGRACRVSPSRGACLQGELCPSLLVRALLWPLRSGPWGGPWLGGSSPPLTSVPPPPQTWMSVPAGTGAVRTSATTPWGASTAAAPPAASCRETAGPAKVGPGPSPPVAHCRLLPPWPSLSLAPLPLSLGRHLLGPLGCPGWCPGVGVLSAL